MAPLPLDEFVFEQIVSAGGFVKVLPSVEFFSAEQMVGAKFTRCFSAMKEAVALVPSDVAQIQHPFAEVIDIEHIVRPRIADVNERIRLIDDDGFGQALVAQGVVAVF